VRVCFLTHYFPPEVGAPQTRIELLARTLAAAGTVVTVHTGFPHYPDGEIRAPYRNRPWHVEHRDGFTVVRSAVYPAANEGFGKRIADHASLALSALVTARLSGPLDVIVSETPPLFTASSGAVYARLKRAASVVNVADRWPATAVELGALTDRRAVAAASALERWTYGQADLVVAPTQGIVTALEGQPETAGRTRRLWPVVDVQRFDPTPPSRPDGPSAPLEVLYAGTVGLAQGLETLVEATRRAGTDVVQTTIAGDGADAERLRSVMAGRRAANVKLRGLVPAKDVPALYAEADAAAVLLRDLPIFRGALPTKTLEAMAAGRAVVVSARGEAADLVTATGAGIAVEPGDPEALAAAFRRLHALPELRRQMGSAGREYAERRFGTQAACDAWTAVLNDAVRLHRTGARRSARAAAGRCREG
jgi:glycosyltransferase involved in cell wall biosynthesis